MFVNSIHAWNNFCLFFFLHDFGTTATFAQTNLVNLQEVARKINFVNVHWYVHFVLKNLAPLSRSTYIFN